MPSNKCHQETPGRQVCISEQDSAVDASTEAGKHPPPPPSGTCRLPHSRRDPQRRPCGLPSQLDGHRAGLLRHPAGGTPSSRGGVAPGRFLCPLTTWQLESHGGRSVGVLAGSAPDLIAV